LASRSSLASEVEVEVEVEGVRGGEEARKGEERVGDLERGNESSMAGEA
jgi:hypothetical protein